MQDPSGASLRPDGDGPEREGDLQKDSMVSIDAAGMFDDIFDR